MTASLETLVVAAYVFATTFRPSPAPRQPHESLRSCRAPTRHVSIAVSGTSDRCSHVLPDLLSVAVTLRRLMPWVCSVQRKRVEQVAEGGVRRPDT